MREPALLRQALRLSRRELRSGLHGFGVFLSCLFLGVFAISAVGSFTAAAKAGLLADASALLGGDLEIRRPQRPLDDTQRAFLRHAGTLSAVVELRTMAGNPQGTQHTLIELKAVDSAYPLYGQLQFEPDRPLAAALNHNGGLIEEALLQRLSLAIGDELQIGGIRVRISGLIRNEPDRDLRPFHLGPRLLVSRRTLNATGLLLPGSLATYRTRVRLADPTGAETLAAELDARFPDAGWRLQTWRQASPRVRTVLDRMSTNLSLLGLCALLVGGLGVAGAVRGYLDAKIVNIATLKCLGATGRVIFTTYLLQILLLGILGAGAGLICGAALPYLLAWGFGPQLPLPLQPALYPGVLLSAALFGLLIALLFSLKDLGRARLVPPAVLFRGYAEDQSDGPGKRIWLAIAVSGLLLALLAFFGSNDRHLAGAFILGALACFALFRLLAALLIRLARRLPRPANPSLRLGLSNIHRRGSPAGGILFSLGLGLTALVMISLVQANLDDMVAGTLPEQAPAFFFLDIQPDQVDAFQQRMAALPGVERLEDFPTLRGRITAINGVPVEQVQIDPKVRWAVRGDRFLSYSAKMPAKTVLTAGKWWPPQPQAEPRLSLTTDLAAGFGVGVGDSLTVNVLGRSVTAEIVNLRQVDWASLELNFALLFAPGVLENAPQTHLAAAHGAPADQEKVFAAISARFPNISIIDTRELLRNVSRTIDRIGTAFRAMAVLALLSGFLVLAGAISADQHRRIQDAVIFKVCGATRRDILLALAAEFSLLGLAAGLISALAGGLAAFAILKGPMDIRFHPHPLTVLATLAIGLGLTLVLGLTGTWKALGQKPAARLREE